MVIIIVSIILIIVIIIIAIVITHKININATYQWMLGTLLVQRLTHTIDPIRKYL